MLVVASSAVSAFEVKGITLGQPMPNVGSGELADVTCTDDCVGGVSFAGYQVFISVKTDDDDIVNRISIVADSESFFEIKELMIKKYGDYTDIKRSTVTTKTGVDYPQESITWKSADGNKITFDRFGFNIKNSIIVFRTRQDIENGLANLKNDTERRLNDM